MDMHVPVIETDGGPWAKSNSFAVILAVFALGWVAFWYNMGLN